MCHESYDSMVPSLSAQSHTVILQDEGRWLCFAAPRRVIAAWAVEDVLPALRAIEDATAQGLHAAGFLSYEATPAFDPAFRVRPAGALPLMWFGIYDAPLPLDTLPEEYKPFSISTWEPSMTWKAYREAIARIKAYIAAGDTYQVNFTMRLHAHLAGSPWTLFRALTRAQHGKYHAWVHLGSHILCSASPELFFRLEGNHLTCKPMKGTAPRGRTWEEDVMQAADLEHSAKNRAENVMIVDMVRNDLGRIAETGSVQVSRLCEVERYTTVWQMTSTVSTCTRASHTEILSALFPCASITGAPKVRTTEIITELEQAPRGAYTGAIGYFAPHRRAQFNIAIRTMQVETATGNLEYGIGGGIVWDSTAESEYDEALTKALVLTARWPDFRLLETLLWRPGKGYFLLHEHLRRLQQSAEYFGFRVEMDAVQARLEGESPHEPVPHRVRLLVEEDGEIEIQASPLPTAPAYPWRVTFAPAPINPADPFLYHKTTHRDLYEITRAACQDYDDVLLWNPRGELTESTVANLTACIDGRWLTPPVSCGLLPGVYRDHLLKCDKLTEAVITRAMLAKATAIALVNSVRGWIPAVLAPARTTDSTEESR